MTDSYLAPAPAPKQLDIIADTILRQNPKMAAICQPGGARENGSHLSTGTKNENGSHLSTSLKAIDARRRKAGIPRQKLCEMAGIHINTYRFALEGHANSRRRTLARLNEAMNQLAAGRAAQKSETLCMIALRLVTEKMAIGSGWDPQLMLSQNFEAENSNDPVWLQASRLRRCAIYLLVEEMRAVGKAEIAHAIGITRQAVHKGVAAIEAERERDPAFHTLMQGVVATLKRNP